MVRNIIPMIVMATIVIGGIHAKAVTIDPSSVIILQENVALSSVAEYLDYSADDLVEVITETQLHNYYDRFSRNKMFSKELDICIRILEGQGLNVTTFQLKNNTDLMIETVLNTAGIRDCKIKAVSIEGENGVYSLASIFDGYEILTGNELGNEAKTLAIEEMIRMQKIGKSVGYDESAIIFSALKYFAQNLELESNEHYVYLVDKIAAQYPEELIDEQKDSMITFAKKYVMEPTPKIENKLLTDTAEDLIKNVKSSIEQDRVISFDEVRKPTQITDDDGNVVDAEIVSGLEASSNLFDTEETETEILSIQPEKKEPEENLISWFLGKLGG